MTCLITGGTGNVGALVAKRLVRQGERVIAFDAAPSLAAIELVIGQDELRNVSVVHGDILDLPLLARTLRTNRVDRIVHLATAVTSTTELNPAHSQRVNVEGTNNVFEAALMAGVSRVVFASSVSVFGPKSASTNGIVSNDAPYDPPNVYGATKALNEMSARQYSRLYGLETVGLRFPSVYGPVAKGSWVKWIPELIEGLVKGLPVSAPHSQQISPWCYVEDISRAVDLAFGVAKGEAHIVTLVGEYQTVDYLVETIQRAFSGSRIGIVDDPSIQILPRYDPVPAKALLGWEYETTVEQGIQQIIDYHKANSVNLNSRS
jgi:nucleoside-diphosphate-sugar epimerase